MRPLIPPTCLGFTTILLHSEDNTSVGFLIVFLFWYDIVRAVFASPILLLLSSIAFKAGNARLVKLIFLSWGCGVQQCLYHYFSVLQSQYCYNSWAPHCSKKNQKFLIYLACTIVSPPFCSCSTFKLKSILSCQNSFESYWFFLQPGSSNEILQLFLF